METINCPSCKRETYSGMIKCPHCNYEGYDPDSEAYKNELAQREQRNAGKRNNEAIQSVVLTTSPYLHGYEIIKTHEIVTSECVFGINIFRDFLTGVRDLIGGRSESLQNVLRDARRTCLHELKVETHSINANAVIGVKLDYSEFTGKNTSMLFLVASGTAVTASKNINNCD